MNVNTSDIRSSEREKSISIWAKIKRKGNALWIMQNYRIIMEKEKKLP